MSSSTRIFIVRHGNTFDKGDVVTRVGGRTDLPLSQSGQMQAEALASYFARAGVQFDSIYSSPLKRTFQTAEAIAKAQPEARAIQAVEFLREIDYGPDENRPEAEVVARIGEAALQLWESQAVVPDGWEVAPDRLIAAWGEFLSELATADAARTHLIVTSNGIARFALKALGNAVSDAHTLKLATGAFGLLELNEAGGFEVRSWNVRP
ncbi:MAG: histidine phosphatase family protein [Pseudomonadota bacterium]